MSRYAVFGNPIAHSKSPFIHRQFASQFGRKIRYDKELVELGKFAATAQQFFDGDGAGLNITVPFKIDAFEFADTLSTAAKQAGAVNTLLLDNGKVHGENTDGIGLVTDISQNLQWPLKGKRLLVLGAGGAVRGIIGPILSAGPAAITIANRTVAKAEQLLTLFDNAAMQGQCQLSAVQFSELSGAFDIVINGTSASLSNDTLPIPASVVSGACCYDMMYSKAPTSFLQWAVENGAALTADGLGMLVEQAAQSFYLWFAAKPDTQPVIQVLRDSL